MVYKFFLFSTVVMFLYLLIMFGLSFLRYKGFSLMVYTANFYPSKGGHTFQGFSEFEKERNLDAVFLGSSHAYRGFDPRIFSRYGFTTFNLGTSGQDRESSETIYRHFIAGKPIKAVVLELYCRQFESIGNSLESAFDIAYNTPGYSVPVDYITGRHDWRFVNMLVYKMYTANSPVVFIDSTYVGKGFSECGDSAIGKKFNYLDTFSPLEEKLKVLENIIQLSLENKQQLILVSHPLPHEYPVEPHRAFKAYIAPLIAKYKIPYFDYTHQHPLHSEFHFYDHNHMNQRGVEIFDSLLINNKEFSRLLHEAGN